MNESTQRNLLALNRRFYTEVAPAFHETRIPWSPGLLRLLTLLPQQTAQKIVKQIDGSVAQEADGNGLQGESENELQEQPLSVLDVGCGNGRFAHILDSKKMPFVYWGVDNESTLLTLAGEHTARLENGQAHFAQVDLAEPAWSIHLPNVIKEVDDRTTLPFDFVLCTATLQHLPGYAMRLQAVREIARMSRGLIILSAWQFFESERLKGRVLDWRVAELSAADVESGDALLPWKQGGYAVRYVHQIDEGEMACLAKDAGLSIVETFRADGRENLNLYAVCQHEANPKK